jgi:hypothetical protein
MIVAATAAPVSHGTAMTWTPTPTTSRALVNELDLKDAIHVGHSTRRRRSRALHRRACAPLSAKLIKKATLKVYQGAAHGMCTTHKDQVNEDLLAFIK